MRVSSTGISSKQIFRSAMLSPFVSSYSFPSRRSTSMTTSATPAVSARYLSPLMGVIEARFVDLQIGIGAAYESTYAIIETPASDRVSAVFRWALKADLLVVAQDRACRRECARNPVSGVD